MEAAFARRNTESFTLFLRFIIVDEFWADQSRFATGDRMGSSMRLNHRDKTIQIGGNMLIPLLVVVEARRIARSSE